MLRQDIIFAAKNRHPGLIYGLMVALSCYTQPAIFLIFPLYNLINILQIVVFFFFNGTLELSTSKHPIAANFI